MTLPASSFLDTELPQPAPSYLLGMKMNAMRLRSAARLVIHWARQGQARSVCMANAHMLMLGHDDPRFRRMVNSADLVVPDGRPSAWILDSEQICGRDLTRLVCAMAQAEGIPVGFYGGSPTVLAALVARMQSDHPRLKIAYVHSPPYRRLSADEDAQVVDAMGRSGVRILFVGLGCPKQERWMYEHRSRLPATLLGIGGAFDMLAGTKPVAPGWMQSCGLEWLFRLALEPRRLWHRNLWHGTRFALLLGRQLVQAARRRGLRPG